MIKINITNIRKLLCFWFLAGICTSSLHAQESSGLTETYCRSYSNRSGIALGGIGAGSIELRKNGQFYNWSIMNNWPVFTGNPVVVRSFPGNSDQDSYLFFLVRYQVEGESPKLKLLQINDGNSEAALESLTYYYPWLTSVESIQYNGTFPFVNMEFSDSSMPFKIKMQSFSPFIPHDVKNSSLPGIYFDFTIVSQSPKPIKVLLIGSLRNLSGYDINDKHFISQLVETPDFTGFSMSTGSMDTTASSWGEMGLFSSSPNCTYYLGWEHKHPYYEKLLVNQKFENIDDTQNRNHTLNGLTKAHISAQKDQRCFSSIGVNSELQQGDTMNTNIIMTWNFPNLYGAYELKDRLKDECKDYSIKYHLTSVQGHYYNRFFSSDIDIARYMSENKKMLFHLTKSFLDNFYSSDIELFVLNQINSQLNTFITSSTLTKSGKFALREGLTSAKPWGPNGTIDVSLYGSAATIALFPDLQKSMMRMHKTLQTEKGEINHGLSSDLEQIMNGTSGVYHRVDLVPNYIQLVLRDFFWTGDMEYLNEMWPSVVKGIEYILNERDNDHNLMPDMNGIMCSYDNFPMYGLSSYIQSQWLAAMKMTTEAAIVLNDMKTYKLASSIVENGSALMEQKLWNGSYYNLSNDYNGNKGLDDGILTDQLIGQWMAHQTGMGHLFPEENVTKSLQSIMKSSFIESFGLRNCSWPQYPDLFPIHESDLWVDQANTCWSGVELGFASLLLYEGKTEDALKIIKTVDDRYRMAGLYWDHQEFGGHYYRPLSAWSIINGYLGMGIKNGNFSFDPKIEKENFKVFFSFGNGTARYQKQNGQVSIEILSGSMVINSISLPNTQVTSESPGLYIDSKKVKANRNLKNGKWLFELNSSTELKITSIICIK
jgi:uncharacterized protein (DUF608 family)